MKQIKLGQVPNMVEILQHFSLASPPISCRPYGAGHINKTYLVETEQGARYILQKINQNVFRNVEGLMENLRAVTGYLRERVQNPREVLQLVDTTEGQACYRAPDGGVWRVFVFTENTICLETIQSPEEFRESAVAFGRFQQLLTDFPAHTLVQTIPNFHNTPDRYRIFKEVLAADPMGRAKNVTEEIAFALAREEEAGTLIRLQEAGELPLRVTHNDTKLNNVLLDADTKKALCVIDLDTVMPGLAAYDFGDSVRFGASSAAEDEQDLSKVHFLPDLYRVFAEGFLEACPGLTEMERQTLPLGAKLMTLENGVRFLTDYLDGDHYFAIHRPGQNLDRARTQFKLVADMERQWDIMQTVIQEAAPVGSPDH